MLRSECQRRLCELWESHYRKVFETGQEDRFEFSFPDPQGFRYFLASVVPELNEKGEVESALSLTVDITDRKRIEEALRKSEELFRLALKNAPVRWQCRTVTLFTSGHTISAPGGRMRLSVRRMLTSSNLRILTGSAILSARCLNPELRFASRNG